MAHHFVAALNILSSQGHCTSRRGSEYNQLMQSTNLSLDQNTWYTEVYSIKKSLNNFKIAQPSDFENNWNNAFHLK